MTDKKKSKPATRVKRGRPRSNAATETLSPQQERFVHEYLSDPEHNATAAARRAGYKAEGQALRVQASRLLKQPAIQRAIADVRAADARRFAVTRERVLEEYAKLAFSDPRRFFNDDGTLKHPTELDDATAAALHMFEVEEEYEDTPADVELEGQPHGGALKRAHAKRLAVGRTAKIKWADKKAALDSIVRLMGWAKEPQQPGTPENPITVIVQQMQGRKAALIPVEHDEEDDDA